MPRAQAPTGEEFVLHDGTRLRDLRELSDALERMSDAQFEEFANAQKNDFAQWIAGSLDDRFLAAAVRKARTRAMLRKALFVTLHR